MNTKNNPDREGVIHDLKYMLNQYSYCARERKAISSALQLLEQDGEDGKRLDWFVENEVYLDEMKREGFKVFSPDGEYGEFKGVTKARFKTYRDAIDSAMASTSTTEEESA